MPFADIRDLRVYYELHGAGEPLVLLNGALDTIDSDWGAHLPAFAERYRVLAFDHRGHGRTSASTVPFDGYGILADDLLALLDMHNITRAHFCGFSDGGITLLYFALQHPERVSSLILAGTQYTNDERTLAMLSKMSPERVRERVPAWAAELDQLHDTHHHAGYWVELMTQMTTMWPNQPDLTVEQIATIDAPTLLVAGERDNFGHPDMQLAMRRAMPRSELCIFPASGHNVMNDQPELFRIAALDFLRRVESL
jgi:pimeloyl-ACP methyl ester carboxylesterase